MVLREMFVGYEGERCFGSVVVDLDGLVRLVDHEGQVIPVAGLDQAISRDPLAARGTVAHLDHDGPIRSAPTVDAELETVRCLAGIGVCRDGVDVTLHGVVDIHPDRDCQLLAQVDVGRSVLPETVQIDAVATLMYDSGIVDRTEWGKDVVLARRIGAIAVELPLRQDVAIDLHILSMS